MFGISRVELIKALQALQRNQCCYDIFPGKPEYEPPKYCDCKYGYNGRQGSGSEETGCPELRSVVGILSTMTDEEYETLCHRANILIGF